MKNKTELRVWTIRVESNREGAYVYNGSDFIDTDDYIEVVEKKHADQREAELISILKSVMQEHRDLIDMCKWYFDKGTEQERFHFLAVDAEGNYGIQLEAAKEKLKALGIK